MVRPGLRPKIAQTLVWGSGVRHEQRHDVRVLRALAPQTDGRDPQAFLEDLGGTPRRRDPTPGPGRLDGDRGTVRARPPPTRAWSRDAPGCVPPGPPAPRPG